jgi:hypothetical protein
MQYGETIMNDGNCSLEDLLLRELSDLARREEELTAEQDRIANELTQIRSRVGHVRALLDPQVTSVDATAIGEPDSAAVTRPAERSRDRRAIADVAFAVLKSRGKEPIHYEELARLVISEGGDLGGSNPAQTLVARLSKDDRFVRPARRGWYSLKEFHPRKRSVGRRAKQETSRKNGRAPSTKSATQ